MCLNLNKITVAGGIFEPELRYTQGENSIAIFHCRLSVTNGGQTLDIPVVLFEETGEKVNSWVQQGIKSLCVIGSLHTEQSKVNGVTTYNTCLRGSSKVLPIADGVTLSDVTVCGRLTKDCEFYPANGDKKSFCRFTVATTKNRGSQNEHTEFINMVAFDRNAENISRMFKKGSSIHVEGNLVSRPYTDRKGVEQKMYEVYVNRWDFIESKKSSGNAASQPVATPAPTSAPGMSVPVGGFAGFGNINLQ